MALSTFTWNLHSPGYFGFRGYLSITCFFSARLRAFLFNVELASAGYLGFGFFFNYQLAFSDRLCDFFFYVELASPGKLGFGFYLILIFLSPTRKKEITYIKYSSLTVKECDFIYR